MARVIIAENYEPLQTAYARTVKRANPGAEVVTVSDGKSLVNQVQLGGFSLILAKYLLNGMDGLRAIKEIRESDKDTPAYLMSPENMEKDAADAGAVYFNSIAPDSFKKLEEIVKKHTLPQH